MELSRTDKIKLNVVLKILSTILIPFNYKSNIIKEVKILIKILIKL